MKSFLHLLLGGALGLALAGNLRAESLVDQVLGVSIAVPEGWMLDQEGLALIPPGGQLAENRLRKIHFEPVKGSPVSYTEAIQSEIAQVAEHRRERKQSPETDHLSSLPVTTKSGLEGLKADFGQVRGEGTHHSIVKYFFRNREGRMFKVCVHVYGDDFVDKNYEDVIWRGLQLTNPGT